jgi:glutaminyl-peptide cyclotransferase
MKYLQITLLLASLFSACTNDTTDDDNKNPVTTIPAPVQLSYSVINVYPHDTSSYTQGLQYVNNALYEGTGNPDGIKNRSKLRKLDYKTGKILKETFLPGSLFGEGITILGDKIYQLTYREKRGFVYNLSDFKLIKEFAYNTEGWGITNDGTHLIMSDGSDIIYYWDAATLKEVKRISVQDNSGLRNNINELEFISGFIYANVYLTDEVVKIDPATGIVVGTIDFSALKTQYPELKNPPSDVLNGIAWDSTGNRLFITGKYWSKLFEVKLN